MDANLKRAEAHYNNFVKVVIKTEEHLEVYLKATTKFTEEEMDAIRDYFEIDHEDYYDDYSAEDDCDCDGGEDCICEIEEVITDAPALDDMTKLELEALAIQEFGVDVDRRLNKLKIIEQIKELSKE